MYMFEENGVRTEKKKHCQHHHHHHLTSLKVMVATPILKSQELTSSFVVNMPVGSRCAKTVAWRAMSLFQKKRYCWRKMR